MDDIFKEFKRLINAVMGDWDVVEFFFCVLLFPLSLLYILFRILQELGKEQ